MEIELPAGCHARPYRGRVDHVTMAAILGAYRRHHADNEQPTADTFDSTYANLVDCDPYRDAVVVERDDGTPIAYGRTSWQDLDDGTRAWVPFAVVHPDHLDPALYRAFITGMERHLHQVDTGEPLPDHFMAFAPHPGPGLVATGEAAWLEDLGYRAFRFGATLVRPHLDHIADLELPDGVELRPVAADEVRAIWDAHQEAFRGQWDFHEPTDEEYRAFHDNPWRDESLWKVAWVGDQVVGQVKSFIVHSENEAEGRLRGYTEEISTHAQWRGQGIAGALLCASLRELRARGMTEAALGADTDNPAAFGLYQRLGFVVTAYEAVLRKPIA
jgi:ribosomal protein S18 acetylase RimI-like enzyme